ncbi:glycoside hydrolase family 25 protein [Streptomyces sp. UNOC14_S4]|uniref:glycoside hydrolase family 25 protein n=1 Tax=Streptomyces sp. UNOC14_S4 TaxID=2872340 RepID=UPI001E537D37|nr:glycoside hydrolase family 25 protein [Streptomyces sp. UNOC14_S4]MCC3769453.1 glycoside hydrolase family 25 protein [Streptomyces sp. UNOC14_S4]
MGIYGQDWASYQSSAPDTTGLSFVFVKVTEGLSYINPRWVAQRDHVKGNGLVWGAYHYPHMANDPREEADFFLAQVNWRPGDLVVLDWEGYDDANRDVPRGEQAAYKEAWLRYVKRRLPYQPVGMYANLDYWRNVDVTGFYGDFLWIATAGRHAGDPGIAARWLFHQYSESGGMDRDYCRLDSVGELRSWALSFQPAPPSQEDAMPQWMTGPVAPGAQPTVVLVPSGSAWDHYPNRCLHLGMDQIAPTPPTGTVRIAIHNGMGWRSIRNIALSSAEGTVDVQLTPNDTKVSLQTTTAGITYAIETW